MVSLSLIKDLINLLEQFESENRTNMYEDTISGFRRWISDQEQYAAGNAGKEPEWENKEMGRSAESVISTLLVHLNKYAKRYSRTAIKDSEFISQEDFIYLITLKTFGAMTKTEIIKKNIQEKPLGVLIINRLIKKGWIVQKGSEADKRKKIIEITAQGEAALEEIMPKVRTATQIISAGLTHREKMDLITILKKMDSFHQQIFYDDPDAGELLTGIAKNYLL